MGALCAGACGSSSPTTPPTPVTTVATSVGSTTTSVPGAQALRYIGTYTQPAPLPSLPLDLSLHFSLPRASLGSRALAMLVDYEIDGGYNTGPGSFTGSITGTLEGTLESGTFTGVMTANLANGCVARRNYSGPLTRQALNWTPGAIIESCGGASPLTAPVNPPAAPPSSPPTTSIAATTTIPRSTTTTSVEASTTTTVPVSTTTTSTTSAACSFNSPAALDFSAQGGSWSTQVLNTAPPAGCAPVLEGVCSWTTASLQQGNGVVLNIAVQVNPAGSPARTCVLTVRNSQNASNFTTRTVNQSAQGTTTTTILTTTIDTTTTTISTTTTTVPAVACTVKITSGTSFDVPATGGNYEVIGSYGPQGCDIGVYYFRYCTWVDPQGSGWGGSQVRFSFQVQPNTGSTRSCSVDIRNEANTVTWGTATFNQAASK